MFKNIVALAVMPFWDCKCYFDISGLTPFLYHLKYFLLLLTKAPQWMCSLQHQQNVCSISFGYHCIDSKGEPARWFRSWTRIEGVGVITGRSMAALIGYEHKALNALMLLWKWYFVILIKSLYKILNESAHTECIMNHDNWNKNEECNNKIWNYGTA